MKKTAIVILVVLLAAVLSACQTHIYNMGDGGKGGKEVYDHWHHHFVFGLVGKKELEMKEICPSGHATIKDEVTFLSGLVTWLCLGGIVYSPTEVTITCKGGKQATLDIPPEDVLRIVKSEAFAKRVAQVLPERLDEVVQAQQALAEKSLD